MLTKIKISRGITIKFIKCTKKPMSVGFSILIVIILLFVTSSGCLESIIARPDIEIIHPEEIVEWNEDVGGTAKNIPDNSELWILVYSHEKGQYYPYGKVVPQNNNWQIPVKIGSDADYGKKFDIIAVLADKNTQDQFRNYVDAVKKDDKDAVYSQAIYEIPDGAKKYDSITVTREEKPWY